MNENVRGLFHATKQRKLCGITAAEVKRRGDMKAWSMYMRRAQCWKKSQSFWSKLIISPRGLQFIYFRSTTS